MRVASIRVLGDAPTSYGEAAAFAAALIGDNDLARPLSVALAAAAAPVAAGEGNTLVAARAAATPFLEALRVLTEGDAAR